MELPSNTQAMPSTSQWATHPHKSLRFSLDWAPGLPVSLSPIPSVGTAVAEALLTARSSQLAAQMEQNTQNASQEVQTKQTPNVGTGSELARSSGVCCKLTALRKVDKSCAGDS